MKHIFIFLVMALLCLSAARLSAQSSVMTSNYYANTFESEEAITGTTIDDGNAVITAQDGAQLFQYDGVLSVMKDVGFTLQNGKNMISIAFNQPLDLRESAKLTAVMRGENIQAGGKDCYLVLVVYVIDVNGNRGNGSYGGPMIQVWSSDWITNELNLTNNTSTVDFSRIKQVVFKLEAQFSGSGNIVTGTVMFDRLALGVEPDAPTSVCDPVSVCPELAVVRFGNKVTLTKDQLSLKEKTSGAVVPIQQLHARYKNREYSIYAAFEPLKEYILSIDNVYYIGDPVTLHTALNTNPVYSTVTWTNSIGQLTADLWGVNDMNVATRAQNQDMADFFKEAKPVIRLHSASRLNQWVDQENKRWNTDKIKADLDNAMYAYRHGEEVMLNMDHIPDFIGTQFSLTEAQEDEMAAFFAQLPGIITQCGYHIGMYEFFNENWNADRHSTSLLPAYWRLLNKIAVAVKAADPTIKVGGSAEAWPWSQSIQGFVDNCAANMDFFSFHMYTNTGRLVNGGLLYDPAYGSSAASPVNYIAMKGLSLPVYMDEFAIVADDPKTLRDHSAASWMACAIKDMALKGLTGTNYWNTEDVNMGLNYNTALALLYRKSGKYLRGDMAEISVNDSRLEIVPVSTAGGRKSVLLINRKDEKTTVINAKNLIGGDVSKIIGWRLDETTGLEENGMPKSAIRSNAQAYIWDPLYVVPTDIVLNPHGMVLLTNDATDVLEEAQAIIEGGSYTVAQAEANTEAAVKEWLAGQINALEGMSTTGVSVTASDITLTSFVAAIAGTSAATAGTNGSFSFTVSLSKGGLNAATQAASGIITATEYTTGISSIAPASLKASVINGRLHVSGLTAGKPWSVYGISGVLLRSAIAGRDHADITLSGRGVYIIVSNGQAVKIAY